LKAPFAIRWPVDVELNALRHGLFTFALNYSGAFFVHPNSMARLLAQKRIIVALKKNNKKS
jgi:hypothetical protein